MQGVMWLKGMMNYKRIVFIAIILSMMQFCSGYIFSKLLTDYSIYFYVQVSFGTFVLLVVLTIFAAKQRDKTMSHLIGVVIVNLCLAMLIIYISLGVFIPLELLAIDIALSGVAVAIALTISNFITRKYRDAT